MKISILSLFLLLSVAASADQNSSGVTLGTFTSESTGAAPAGFVPFLGLGAGYTSNEPNHPVESLPTSMKLLGSYYLPNQRFVFDLGLGMAHQQFYHDAGSDSAATAGVVEAAARYQWPARWQGGIVFNDFMNQGANYAASQGDAQFLGVQVLKEFNMSNQWLARAGGRAMTETNNTGSAVNMFLVEFQIGWNYPTQTTAVETVTTTSQPETLEAPHSLLTALPKAKVAQFDLSQYSIKSFDQAYLKKLGKALSENKDLFSEVKVHGYADISGPVKLNQKLSLLRAENVRNQLIKSGNISSKNVVAIGEGATDSTEVLSGDRKVELEFTGVKDHDALQNLLSSIE